MMMPNGNQMTTSEAYNLLKSLGYARSDDAQCYYPDLPNRGDERMEMPILSDRQAWAIAKSINEVILKPYKINVFDLDK